MCKGVKKIFLKNNKLKELQPGKFDYLSNLQDLDNQKVIVVYIVMFHVVVDN